MKIKLLIKSRTASKFYIIFCYAFLEKKTGFTTYSFFFNTDGLTTKSKPNHVVQPTFRNMQKKALKIYNLLKYQIFVPLSDIWQGNISSSCKMSLYVKCYNYD